MLKRIRNTYDFEAFLKLETNLPKDYSQFSHYDKKVARLTSKLIGSEKF